MQLMPPLLLVAGIVIGLPALELWAAVVSGVTLVTWFAYYRIARLPVLYAFLYPVGAAVALYIALSAVSRGSRVEWKGREYESTGPARV
jgi:hypothetical protein